MSYWFARKLSANLYDIYHCCVYSEESTDDGQRNCPKRAEFYSKNKIEKLVHLVGFIITRKLRIYSDTKLVFLPLAEGGEWFPKSYICEGCRVERAVRKALTKKYRFLRTEDKLKA